MKMLSRSLAVLVAVLALVAAACGDDDSGATTTAAGTTPTTSAATTAGGGEASQWGLPVIDPLDVPDGDIGIAGSSTVFPLSTAVLTQWIDEGGPEYTIDSIGSGGGLERFCVEGTSDIANASRPIKQDEIDACAAIGRTPIEVRVGTDALTVVISPGNHFAGELTLAQVAAAFAAPDGATWADVDPSFPAHPIAQYSPGTDSGTFDFFNEVVYEEAEPSPILEGGAEIVGEDDNLTVRGVSEDGCTEGDLSTTCAIGYFGFAYYIQNAGVLTPVAVDGVEPSEEAVNANTYVLSRPLFMYTDAGIIAGKPQVAQFMAYYLNNVNDLIGGVGYFPAPDSALQEAADHIAEAAGF